VIGPADIRFELWFNDQKLSRDESIKVEWIPTSTPQMLQMPPMAEMPGATEALEMPVVPPTPIDAAPQRGAFENLPGGKAIKTSSFAVINKRTADVGNKKPRGRGGLFGKSALFGRVASSGS
jgi:hypothetical protein